MNSSLLNSSNFGFSIVVCCYNSAKKIEKTLIHLFELEFKSSFFEIIVVDNSSNDDTPIIASKLIQKHKMVDCKVVTENKQGLNNARIKGVQEAKFNFIIFCDDDNWFQKDYLSEVEKILITHPKASIIGGNPIPVFEKEKPFWFDQQADAFACKSLGDELLDISKSEEMLIGAGLVIKKDVFKKIVQSRFVTTDRKGKNLSSGGDNEICLYAKLFGEQILYNPNMIFSHFMTSDRMNWNYCRKLHVAFGQSESSLQPYHFLLQKKEAKFNQFYWLYFSHHFKKIFGSYKRLYVFLIKKQEGEEYIPIYERSWSTIKYSLRHFTRIKRHFNYLNKQFVNRNE